MEPRKRSTAPESTAEQCTLTKKEGCEGPANDMEDPQKAARLVEDCVQTLEGGSAVDSDGEGTCQQTGQLADVSCMANNDASVGNQGKVKQKHPVKDFVEGHGTATNEHAVVRKCKHNQKRGFVCDRSVETDEETLKREALEAILQETKRAKTRADTCGPSGWLPNRTGKPNRRFLSRLLTQAARHGGSVRSKPGSGSTQS